jgi:hypothetical protein
MKAKIVGLLFVVGWLCGCSGEPPVEPSDEVKNGPKLTQEQAEKFKNILPGSRKSQSKASETTTK